LEEAQNHARFFFVDASSKIGAVFKNFATRYVELFDGDGGDGDGKKDYNSELGTSFITLVTRAEDEVRKQINWIAKECPQLKEWTTIDDYYFILNDLMVTSRQQRSNNQDNGRESNH
jgi:hypothetical protein